MAPDLPPDQSPPADESAPPPFQLLRSKHDRKLGGVAGGLAAAAQLDPTLVRVAIVLGFLTGWGILAYLIAWLVIPEEDPARGRYLVPAPEPTAKYLRIGLTVLGAIGLLQVVGTVLGIVSSAIIGIGLLPIHIFGLGDDRGFEFVEAMLGLLLVMGGCLVLFRRHLPRTPMALASITPGSGGGGATAGSYGTPSSSAGSGGSGDSGGSAGFSARASAAARAARTNGPLLVVRAAGWLVALWFLAAGVLGTGFWVTGALDVRLPALPILAGLAALGLLGYTLIRSRRLAAVIGAMALLVVPATLAAALTRVDGQAGDRSVTPIVVTDLDRTYRHAVGAFDLDLSQLQLPAGSRTPIDISMGVGQIEVVLPWDAEVEARASVGAGSFDLFGNRQTGVNLEGRTRSPGQPGAPAFDIRGKAGAGEVIVRRADEPFVQKALRTGQPVPLACEPTVAGSVRCWAGDGVTQTPALSCVVAEFGAPALCRPTGEPEPVVHFANDPGTRRCQVPAGGGEATCTAPIPRPGASDPGGSFTCTIPPGGGQATCQPAAADPNAPAPPPSTTAPGAPPGEYRCTVPEGGGAATCEPA